MKVTPRRSFLHLLMLFSVAGVPWDEAVRLAREFSQAPEQIAEAA